MNKNEKLLINTLIAQKVRESLILNVKEHLNDKMDSFIEEFISSIKEEGVREEVLIDLLSTLDISDVMLMSVKKELEEENIELL